MNHSTRLPSILSATLLVRRDAISAPSDYRQCPMWLGEFPFVMRLNTLGSVLIHARSGSAVGRRGMF